MLKSLIKALGLVAGLTLSGLACAVGMGGVNLSSAMGEPLKLEIELETASKAETNNLSVRLASPEMFKAAGMDYPYGLPQLKFQIETHAGSGQPYLKVTSVQPVNEPFVSLLVELSWPSGKLLREYTFLLDPPGYAADQPQAAEVKPVEPGVVDESPIAAEEPMASPQDEEATGEVIAESAAAPMEEKTPAEEMPVAAIPDTADEISDEAAASDNVASGDIRVKRGDTLRQIASQAKPPDVSLERMLVALYRANADAFYGNNMNRLQAGKILRVPEQSELDELSQIQAVKEIRAQVTDWNAYRQRLAAASGAVAERVPRQETSGKISTTVADQAPPAKGSAKEVLRLSKGEAPGDKTQDQMHAQQEESIAKDKALAESKERVALLEKNVNAMQRLLALKGQPIPPQSKAESTGLGALPPVSAPASAVQPAKPVAQAEVETPQPSLLDELLGEPLYLAGGAAILLGLGGLVGLRVVLRRRTQRRKQELEDVGSTTGRIAAPIAPSPETGDFTNTVIVQASPINAPTDDVDPISEADLFLNFGRDEQAEEILKDALIKNPANHQIHLKLLSIYLNRRDVAAFSAIARQLQDSGDAAAWERAAAMGLKLEPNNPIYGGDGSAAAEAEAIVAKAAHEEAMFAVGKTKQQPFAMDFDLGLAAAEAPAVTMDFDLGLTAAEAPAAAIEPSQDSTLVLNAPMDFDVTGSRPSGSAQSTENAETPAMHLDDLIFDVTASHKSIPEVAKEAADKAEPADADQGPAFMLDFPGADKFEAAPEQAVAKPSMDIGLAGISLNLNEPVAPAPAPAAGGEDEHWHDVATKLDLANAYKEMGDAAGACDILEEVVRDGDDQQRAAAEALLRQLR